MLETTSYYIVLFLQGVGAVYLLSLFVRLLTFTQDIFLPGTDFKYVYGVGIKQNEDECVSQPWAVVSGATDGIGKAFSIELSKRGLNICLLARNRKKAEGVVQLLSPSVQSKIIEVDFQDSLEKNYLKEQIASQLDNLDICFLVNNVGIGELQNFQAQNENHIDQSLSINCASTLVLSKLLLPRMLKRKWRSAIINLSSIFGEINCPYHSVYSGTKRFLDVFSRSLAMEVSSKVDVMSLKPLMVTTPMTRNSKSFGAISPEQCVRGALQQLGREKSTNGDFRHRLQQFFITSWLGNLYFNYIIIPRMGRSIQRQKQKDKKQQ